MAKDRVGAKAPARFLCITEEDSLSKITEVTHTEAIVPLVQFQTGVVIIVEGTFRKGLLLAQSFRQPAWS